MAKEIEDTVRWEAHQASGRERHKKGQKTVAILPPRTKNWIREVKTSIRIHPESWASE